jgi:protein-tyrosine phosphatase
MCEALMKRTMATLPFHDVTVSSAGLNAVPGRAAHSWAIAAARELEVSLEGHRARLLTRDMVDQADAIFVMDYQNLAQLLSRYPEASKKIYMLGAFASERYPTIEIADPYYSDERGTRSCYSILKTCIENLVDRLCQE